MIGLFYDSVSKYLNHHLTDDFFWILVFRKCLYAFLLLKILFSASVVIEIDLYQPLFLASKIMWISYAPLLLSQINSSLFLGIFILLVVIGLLFKSNYITAFVIFWFSVSLSKLMIPIINGSDLILNLFLLISVVMSHERFLSGSQSKRIIAVVAVLIAQIQLSLIYFLSGYDKLLSEAWRSGGAIFSVLNLNFFQNPFFSFDLSSTAFWVLGWIVILFELGFAIMIWVKVFRIPILIAGTLFHICIIFFLGLLDFGILMILCYAIFFPLGSKRDDMGIGKAING